MSFLEPPAVGVVSTDGKGNPTGTVSVRNWRSYRVDVTAGAWVLIGDGAPRNYIVIASPTTNVPNIILSHANTGVSNDPANDTCGLDLTPGTSKELAMTANLKVYARVATGGAACRLSIAEAL